MDLNYCFFPKSESFRTVIISLVTREVFIHCFLTFLYLSHFEKKYIFKILGATETSCCKKEKKEEKILFEIDIMSIKPYC